MLSILGNIDTAEPITELRFSDGRILRLPTAMLEGEPPCGPPESLYAATPEGLMTVPIIEEQVEVSKRTVPTAHVRLQKTVGTYNVQLDEPLTISTFHVERIPYGHVVDAAPEIRQQGNTTVYPIVEERLVLTKELILVEEVHVTNEFSERRDNQVVSLRRERLDVFRQDLGEA